MPKYQPLLAAFPGQAMLIRRAVLSDSNFAAICDDYLACLSAITHWSNTPDLAGRADEYRRTLEEIKTEVAEFLADYATRQGSTSAGSNSMLNDTARQPDPRPQTEKHR